MSYIKYQQEKYTKKMEEEKQKGKKSNNDSMPYEYKSELADALEDEGIM